MFDIANYEIELLIFFLIVLLIFNFNLLKKYLTSLLDPLFYHILWLSLGGTLILAYPFTHTEINIAYIIILEEYFFYIFFLYGFFKIFSKKTVYPNNIYKYKIYFKTSFLIFLFLIYLGAKTSFILYVINSDSLGQIFLWRILEFHGRNPIERIVSLGIYPFLLFIIFFQIKFKKNNIYALLVLCIFSIIEILAGGRSSILSILFAFGAFIFVYQKFYTRKSKLKIFYSLGIAVFIIFLFVSILKTSEYIRGSDIDPMYTLLNRFFATFDGVDYYLTYDGIDNIASGLYQYFMSIFGIYVKGILNIHYKNIGWQLSELASGSTLSFAQGSNFTFILQGLVLNPYFAIIYPLFIAFIVAFLRYGLYFVSPMLFFSYVVLSLSFASDIEYSVLRFISISIIFVLIKIIIYIYKLKL